METRLGRIQDARFGNGGYDDVQLGFSVTLGGDGWGTGDFSGNWASYPERAKYSEQEWRDGLVEAVIKLRDTLRAAKKQHVAQLVGVPVEVTFDGNRLQSWRVLTEVL